MRVRPDRLADALVRALPFNPPGTIMLSVDDRGRVTQIEGRERWGRQVLTELPAVAVAEEPPLA